MKKPLTVAAVLACLLALGSCRRAPVEPAASPAPEIGAGGLLRVGSVTVTEGDLEYHLREKHAGRDDAATRRKALDELARLAAFSQAALDAGLDSDPVFRAEMARILGARLKETVLAPQLKNSAVAIPVERLREIYKSQSARFQSAEKRQIAVLWLNPGADPERLSRYQVKMAQAREWYLNHNDLKEHPEQGFSVLSVDYSEHAASRYKGGLIGWLERDGGVDPWSKAVAEVAFSLKEPGEVSAVVSRPEGVFLVRNMAVQQAVIRPFEAVAPELERAERQRLMKSAEIEFNQSIEMKYPAVWPK